MKSSSKTGFTIVELLVVIVIIGILAAITIVSYTGVTSKANVASLNSDLSNASQQLKLFQVENTNSNYPTTIDCTGDTATNKCLKSSTNTTYDYKSDTNPKSFCLTATKSNQSYNIDQDNTILAGPCPVLNLDASNSLSYSGTGSTWYDLSGNGNDGAMNGGVTYGSGNGGVMGFDGVSGYVDTGMTNSFSQFSVSTWFYTTSFSGEKGIITKYTSGFSNGNWTLQLSGSVLLWDINDGVQKSYTFPLAANTWYYAVGTYDNAGGANNGKLYVNGLLRGTFSANAMALNSDKINVGKASTGLFNGYMSNARIYTSVLLADEILQSFNNQKGRYGL